MIKRLFPQQSGDSSTDEEEVFADSESNVSLSDGDPSLAPQTDELFILKCGDFVIANVHTAAGKCKKFIGELVSGPDEDEDFEISFLERSRKIKNGFFFPKMEDLASIGKKDIEKILPPPHAAAQTKQLCGMVNLTLIYHMCNFLCVHVCLCIFLCLFEVNVKKTTFDSFVRSIP